MPETKLILVAITSVFIATVPTSFANGDAPKVWRHGVLDAKSDAGFSYMVNQGFAEKEGLQLKMFPFKADTQLLQALLAGQLDSFEGSPGNDIMAAARGADVKIIGCTWPGLPHVILL
jgi:NitT/TauT family transport system substrate-binding protein